MHINLFARAERLKLCTLAIRILRKTVDRHDDRQTVAAQIGEMALEIGEPAFQRCDIFAPERITRHAAVHFQCADRGDEYDGRRLEARLPALDIEKFFRTEIRAETRFGYDIIGELQPGARRDG
jgi:hypothetical protein